jgi:glycosyltransferase involved in cell wall biosynthesis
MHVDWNWIMQRPHFLAEGLSQYFKIDVWHERTFVEKNRLVRNAKHIFPNLAIYCIKRLPFARFGIIYHINAFINKIILRNYYKNADIIWVPHPLYFSYYEKGSRQIVVYDCMDDMLGFDLSRPVKTRIKKYEERLIGQADIIITSSDYLRKKLMTRYNVVSKSIAVVNNAIFLPPQENNQLLPEQLKNLFRDQSTKKIVYVGTISKWFDFELILNSLKQNNKIEYLLFGPIEVDIPLHPRIKIAGQIEHKHVLAIIQCADCLVMPFVVTELIKSVNPVKAYEYIYAHKPILLPLYDETEKFKEFAYLYYSPHEYFKLLDELILNSLTARNSQNVHRNFALHNTWDNRIEEIKELLLKYALNNGY